MDPASIAFAALAEEYRRAGRFDEAVATCEAGLQRHPAYLSARVTLGRALLEMERFEDARDELEHVLRVAPENLAAIRGLAEIHQRRGMRSEEAEGENTAVDTPPEAAEPIAPLPVPEVAPDPAPLRAIPLSSLAPDVPGSDSAPDEPVPVPDSIPIEPQPPAREPERVIPPAVLRAADPDETALPALEALLAAVRRARDTMPTGDTFPMPTDR